MRQAPPDTSPLGSISERRPASWSLQAYLLTGRVGSEALRNPVLLLNLVLALLFLLVYDGAVGGLQSFVQFGSGNYYNFILPAAILAASIGGGAAGLLLVSDIESGYLRRQLAMPLRRSAVVTSLVVVAAGQVGLQTVVVIAFGLLLGVDPQTGVPGLSVLLAIAFVWGAGFACYSVAVAITTRDAQMTAAANLIFIPLIFFSPLLVPYAYLKPWMQIIADVNPTRYVMDGMRSLIIEGWVGSSLMEAFGASILFGTLMGAAALIVIRYRLPDSGY
jgi:ABC transporter DrrB family efflux protein